MNVVLSCMIQHVVRHVLQCETQNATVFDQQETKKNPRPILNLDMANQFELLVFDRIAQFYDTLTLEQKDASWIPRLFKRFLFFIEKRHFMTNSSMEFAWLI